MEAVKRFHWDTVFLELMKKMPTFMHLLHELVPKPTQRKPLLCFLASQVLKARHKHLGLVQRATSIMIVWEWYFKTGVYVSYSMCIRTALVNTNIHSIQVFSKPLNICLSYQGTLNIVSKISEDHDVEVQEWLDEWMKLVGDTIQ